LRDSGRRALEIEHLYLWKLCFKNLEATKKALELGNSFHGGLAGKPGKGLTCRELMCGTRFWDGCCSL
jgi:hypothetical protein